MDAFRYPEVTQELLQAMVKRMREVGSPKKIVLFGSRATDKAKPDSDIDLLIVEDSNLPRYRRSSRYRKALTGMFPSKDIVVWTPDEIQEWKMVPNAFINQALSQGKVLFEDQP